MKRDIELEATLVAKYAVVAPVLDERSRRRWAAAESLAIGYGGDAVVSSATGLARETIRKGRRETGAAQRGLEDRRIKLGCVLPGESPAVFEDALRRLASAATYLYQDGPRYWYATQPTVTKLAEDRAEQLRRDQDRVIQAIGDRLRAALRDTGGFSRIHSGPRSGHDVPDERERIRTDRRTLDGRRRLMKTIERFKRKNVERTVPASSAGSTTSCSRPGHDIHGDERHADVPGGRVDGADRGLGA